MVGAAGWLSLVFEIGGGASPLEALRHMSGSI